MNLIFLKKGRPKLIIYTKSSTTQDACRLSTYCIQEASLTASGITVTVFATYCCGFEMYSQTTQLQSFPKYHNMKTITYFDSSVLFHFYDSHSSANTHGDCIKSQPYSVSASTCKLMRHFTFRPTNCRSLACLLQFLCMPQNMDG